MKEEIYKLYLDGLSYNKIANELNCSKSTVAYHCIRFKKGYLIKDENYLFKYTKKSLLKYNILKLRNEGKSYNEICEILDCSKSTISYHCFKNNMTDIGLNKLRMNETEIRKCKFCCSDFEVKINSKKRYCKRDCYDSSDLKKEIGRKFGLYSSQLQKEIRRSKNEIYFCELCKGKFNNVLSNEALFNGWDADVIIPEFKIAILWNGIWHYKKITKKHSIEQVQNRDKIKIKEIKKCGFIPYIIKDLGVENKKFVDIEFEKFTGYISSLS